MANIVDSTVGEHVGRAGAIEKSIVSVQPLADSTRGQRVGEHQHDVANVLKAVVGLVVDAARPPRPSGTIGHSGRGGDVALRHAEATKRGDDLVRLHRSFESRGDEGVISGWEQSPYDLRRRYPRPKSADARRVVIPADTAATLRDLQLLDSDTERLVFRAQGLEEGVALFGDDDDIDELMGYVAAEANNEGNRRRQRRLDAAFEVLSRTIDGQQRP